MSTTEQQTTDYLSEIESMDYQQMLTAWMTATPDHPYMVEGSEEKQAFDARFQKLRAEAQPEESKSSNARGNNTNRRNKKKGKNRAGKR